MGDFCLRIGYMNYSNFCQTCDVRQLHNRRWFYGWASARYHTKTEILFHLDLQKLFTVPGRLKMFLETQNGIKKYQFMEAFISFLLQLLHPETGGLFYEIKRKFKDQTENLQKELRILLTFLGDLSLLLCDDEHQEFQRLWAEFEAVTIEAASLVCSLVYPFDLALAKLEEDFDVVLNHLDLLITNIRKSLNLLPSAYITPKTSVVDSLLIVDSLIYDLDNLMNRHESSITDVKDQVKRLHQGLIVTHSSIKDIRSPQPSEIGEFKVPLMRLGDMAHAAEYLIISFLVGDAPLWYLIPRLIDINNKIELIGTELLEITKEFKSGALKFAEYSSKRLLFQVDGSTEVDDITVGFEEDILDLLVGGTKRLQVISIFGMPGLGKTTQAKKLYNHPLVTYSVHKLSWCVVSLSYQKQTILTDILINLKLELGKDSISKMDEESLVEHIYKTLKGRRYLIVMDDVWDSNVWDDLRRCFPDDEHGSRILFTSRNKDVAPRNSIIYAQPSLSKDQCWKLLKKKVFHDKPCPPELLRIGKKIAANCGGLPLTIVVIAGILSNMDRERSTWEEVERNLASYILEGEENSSVMQILELSYKHLSDHLKPCFLYFGAFAADGEIPAKKIMRFWIAEGFVRKEEEESPDDRAEECLRELINKNLVMVAKRRSDGGVKSCVIHDLLRDLCLKICEEDNFLKLEMNKHTDSATWSCCQHMRSFHDNSLIERLYVRDTRLLRILYSDWCFEHLIGIEYLVNLRYLVISADSLASIGGLVNLEYLHVQGAAFGEMYLLPPAIVEMRKLRYIRFFHGVAKYHKHCNTSQPNDLEYLSGIIIHELKDEKMLKCSPHLRKLKCRYVLPPRKKRASPHFDLRFLTQLDSLH